MKQKRKTFLGTRTKIYTITPETEQNISWNPWNTIKSAKYITPLKASYINDTQTAKVGNQIKQGNHPNSKLHLNRNRYAWSEPYTGDPKRKAPNKFTVNQNISILKQPSNNYGCRYNESLFVQSIFSFLIPIMAIAMSTIITVWPQHNIIRNPEYWYEAKRL